MRGEILGALRATARGEVGWRGDEEAGAIADAALFERAVGERPEAHGEVDAFLHQIDALVRQAKINADIGMERLEGEDQPRDVPDAERRRRGDADRARRRRASVAHVLGRLVDLAQDVQAAGIEAGALVRQGDAAGGPAEEGGAERDLKFAQVAGHRRLSGAEFARDGGQIAAFGDAHEGTHALQGDVGLIHFSAQSYPLPKNSAEIARRLGWRRHLCRRIDP
jgi:hypothetical protein